MVKAGIKSRTLHVDYLARIEGEGALYIKMDGNQIEDVKLKIFEPPRFFEALLRGREIWKLRILQQGFAEYAQSPIR